MKRVVEPEILDELSPEHPDAIVSRRDLRRLNHIMHHVPLMRSALVSGTKVPPVHIIELGAGDGSLMLELAAQMHREWPNVTVLLVDRQPVVSQKTLSQFQEFGWTAKSVVADVFDWLPMAAGEDIVIANLFLHHFSGAKLAELLYLISGRAKLFVACETRRDWVSLAATRLLGFIGCNAVTRHDAVKSAQAGFVDGELSALWPGKSDWRLTERRARLFTHLFVAQRPGP
ncbi:MAG TPA: methyltransferase domain-containing protein [Verrucomicrobiae bacterium]|jgi:hypothetical protein|nr:methyltransferase domain-containing protein [Verrucomicrobiae bacterium]